MFETLIERFKDWARIQSGIERLRQLDDHQLADMGIERELIVQIAQTGVIVTLATLADDVEQRAAATTRHVSPARPPSLGRKAEDCGSVPSMS